MNYCVVIPARLKSSRLPRKPLLDIVGKSMIQRTFEQVNSCIPFNQIFIATDSKEILNHCRKFTPNVILTSESCETGTDRISEFSNYVDFDFFVNVQGDEPLIDPQDILAVIEMQRKYPNDVINGYSNILKEDEYYSFSIPKMVISKNGFLLYSSRSPIPGNKLNIFEEGIAKKQVCVYSFPRFSLELFGRDKVKTNLEKIEDIEIIRFLENGYNVRMVECFGESMAVDTESDLIKVREIILKINNFES
jgi:3-deoxy-manno-octulosonate cytidylyltransferase (CMP-KDO synthetase)